MSGSLVPGPSGPATNASCVQAVNERIKEKTCFAHTATPTHTHTISRFEKIIFEPSNFMIH